VSTVHTLKKSIAAAVVTPRWGKEVNAKVVNWVHAVTELRSVKHYVQIGFVA